ncbi:MAG: VCBS repeat-containing protein [Alphaproteobacteria bacterium]|nr:VCBS repeat-containing protein [Alphaproteobacteria bacterium]
MSIVVLLSLLGRAFGQEVCSGGVDDDLDGVIDCADTDCGLDLTCCGGDTSDADGDGLCDVLDACPLPGEGLEDFAVSDLDTGAGATALVVADLDGDGVDDLVATAPLRWMRGDGSRFGAPVVLQQPAQSFGDDVVAVDLDGDGDLDLVVTAVSGAAHALLVFDNLGGTFAAPQVIFRPSTFVDLGPPADLDGDGDLDLPVADGGASWFENVGTGGLGPRHAIVSSAAWRLWPADVDGDGDVDLFARSSANARLLVLENVGGGAFGAERVVLGADWPEVQDLAFGDVDGDGDLDLVPAIASGIAHPLQSWHANVGAFTFLERPLLSEFGGRAVAAVADLDGDGAVDIVLADTTLTTAQSTLDAYMNSGGGVFLDRTPLPAVGGVAALATPALDGDGDPDLVAATTGRLVELRNDLGCVGLDTDGDGLTDAVELSLGLDALHTDTDGDGVDDPDELATGLDPRSADTDLDGWDDGVDGCPLDFDPTRADLDLDGIEDACDVCLGTNATGDVDGDGVCDDFDLCEGDDATGDVDGDGWCADSDICPSNADPDQLDSDGDGVGDSCDVCPGEEDALGDVDGDGWCADVDGCPLVADPLQTDTDGDGTPDACDVCGGDGDGSTLFGAPRGYLALGRWGPYHLTPADLDGDGDVDLIFAGDFSYEGFHWSSLYTSMQGASGLEDEQELLTISSLHVDDLCADDLDGDGADDVVYIDGWIRTIIHGRFHEFTGTSDARAVATGDLDGDGRVDIAFVTLNGDLGRLRQTAGGWAPRVSMPSTLWEVRDLMVVDVDGDGVQDVMAAVGDAVAWHRGLGGGAFGPRRDVSTAVRGARSLSFEDMDGDGLRDVVALAADAYRIVVMRGRGGGAFDAPTVLVDRTRTHSVTVADLDRDGDMDFALTDYDYTWWYENLGRLAFEGHVALEDGFMAQELVAENFDDDDDPDLAWGLEWSKNLSRCVLADGDHDGLTNAEEVQVFGTDPTRRDTDGGGLGDGGEVAQGSDPLDPTDDSALLVSSVWTGTAGQVNELAVAGATPGGTVVLLASTERGSGWVPMPSCSSARSGLWSPVAVASAVADAGGRALLTARVPGLLAGTTTMYQVVDVATCQLSRVGTEVW